MPTRGQTCGICSSDPETSECAVDHVVGLDGGPEEGVVAQEATIQLLMKQGGLAEQVAVDVAAILETIRSDPETSLLLLRLQRQPEQVAFAQDLTQAQIAVGLSEAYSEMKMAEILFQDPVRAVKEMENDGLIAKDRVKHYRKNPKDLELDTKRSLYFTVVALAAAGGYI